MGKFQSKHGETRAPGGRAGEAGAGHLLTLPSLAPSLWRAAAAAAFKRRESPEGERAGWGGDPAGTPSREPEVRSALVPSGGGDVAAGSPRARRPPPHPTPAPAPQLEPCAPGLTEMGWARLVAGHL